jgi:hypothetical protein
MSSKKITDLIVRLSMANLFQKERYALKVSTNAKIRKKYDF